MQYTIPITPVAGSRPRVTRWATFYPKKHTDFQKEIKLYLATHTEIQPILDSIMESGIFEVEFYVPIPKSYSKKKAAELVGKPHQQRPDIDNFIKITSDCLFPEDSAIWKIVASKYWAEEGAIKLLTHLSNPLK
jgi:Holliday junction resolvase RusA-like endonuclease